MEDVIYKKIDRDYIENNKFYFFTLMTNRFDVASEKMAEILTKKFGKIFEPIYVYSAEPNKFYKKINYIIINDKLAKSRKRSAEKKFITVQDYEDLNIEFRKSFLIKDIIKRLIKKQGEVFIYSFTSFGLKSGEGIKIIGPSSRVVEKFDNKIEQIKLFKKLSLSVNKTKFFDSFSNLRKTNFKLPCFISPSYTSGAGESAVILDKNELDIFYRKLRPINRRSSFLAAKYIEDVVLSPNSTAIVCGPKETRMLQISDQILKGIKHLGNIYPSKASDKNLKIISSATIKVGNYLSKLGFKGLFGCDFIIDSKNKCYIVDLNPRRQAGYLMVFFMSNTYNLIEIELKIALGEDVPEFNFNDFKKDIIWAHTKLVPHDKNKKLICEFKNNRESLPFSRLGKSFSSIFYPAGYILDKVSFGYYIVSGNNYEHVLKKILKNSEKILSNSLKN